MSEAPDLQRFVGDQPTRSLEEWHDLLTADRAFPIQSHRPLVGPVLVWFRKLLRPILRLPLNDLFERQRVLDLILVETMINMGRRVDDVDRRLGDLEATHAEGLDDLMRYVDALYFRVDAKLDGHAAAAREQLAALRAVTRSGASGPDEASRALRAVQDADYLAFEDRQRGSRQEILDRIASYEADLVRRGRIADLGCGRGEVLEFLAEHGVEALGVDTNSAMVRRCLERGLSARETSILDFLQSTESGSWGALTCFHVVEHLDPGELREVLDRAFQALRPGGLLLIETPNPESILVGASTFWIDPTHRRPVHPAALSSLLEDAGFEGVEIRPRQPVPASERLPEIEPDAVPAELRGLVDRINALRDRIDDRLHGHRDYAALAYRPTRP